MKHLLAIALTSIFALNALGWAQDQTERPEPLPVYIFIGHNNAAGWKCSSENIPEAVKDPVKGAQQWNGEKWSAMEPQQNNQHRSFGPPLGFANALREKIDQAFGVITHAVAFSTLADGWNPPDGKDYKELISMVKAASDERPIKVVAVFNVNGQNDAKKEDLANAYADNQKKLVEAFRKDFENPEMQYITIRMHDGGFPQENTVRKAQSEAKLTHFGWINTDDIPRPDKFHYSPEGYIQLGRRFAEKYVEMQKEAESK